MTADQTLADAARAALPVLWEADPQRAERLDDALYAYERERMSPGAIEQLRSRAWSDYEQEKHHAGRTTDRGD